MNRIARIGIFLSAIYFFNAIGGYCQAAPPVFSQTYVVNQINYSGPTSHFFTPETGGGNVTDAYLTSNISFGPYSTSIQTNGEVRFTNLACYYANGCMASGRHTVGATLYIKAPPGTPYTVTVTRSASMSAAIQESEPGGGFFV